MAASIAGYMRSPVPAPMVASRQKSAAASDSTAAAQAPPGAGVTAASAAPLVADTPPGTAAGDPGWRMVVLVGTDHVRGRVGVPDRVTRRTGQPTFTMVPMSVPWAESGFPAIERPLSDAEGEWVLYTQPLINEQPSIAAEAQRPQGQPVGLRVADPRGPKPRLSVEALRLNQRGTITEI